MSQMRRKITLQLIPLLDLLLIVIFVQFMEMRQATERMTKRTDEAEKASLAANERVTSSIAAGQAELKLQKEDFQLQQLKAEAKHLTSMSEIERLGNLAAELFKLPETFVNKALNAKSQEDQVKLRQLLDDLPKGKAADVVHQMATLSELRRLCDVWELHLDDHDVLHITFPPASTSIQFEDQTEFERKLLTWYKSLSPTKNLVVIQLTWGDASAGPKFWVREGITRTLDRMRTIRNGMTLFEFIVLGFRPSG